MPEPLDIVRAEITDRLNEIAALFKGEPKITIIVRAPTLDDGDLVMTNDDLGAAQVALKRLADRA